MDFIRVNALLAAGVGSEAVICPVITLSWLGFKGLPGKRATLVDQGQNAKSVISISRLGVKY